MLRLLCCLTFLIVISSVAPVGSVTYAHDEMVWTKRYWDEYKLDFPWSQFQHRESEANDLFNGLAKHLTVNTLAGPQHNLDALIKEDLERSQHQPGGFMVSALDEFGSVTTAATVSQCKVCSVLATHLWNGLTAWVNVHQKMPSRSEIVHYAEQLCDFEVPVEVLKEWVILQAKIKNNKAQQGGLDEQTFMEFYLFSQRHRQHATVYEIAAVRRACIDIVDGEMFVEEHDLDDIWTQPSSTSSEDDPYDVEDMSEESMESTEDILSSSHQQEQGPGSPAKEPSTTNLATDAGTVPAPTPKGSGAKPLITAVEHHLETYYTALVNAERKELIAAEVKNSGSEGIKGKGSDQRDSLSTGTGATPAPPPAAPPADAGPEPQRLCYDKHPQCEYWARVGECTANPKYMVGTPFAGHCRKACKACDPPTPSRLSDLLVHDEDVVILTNVSSTLLGEVVRQGCVENVPCIWANAGQPEETLKAAATDFRSSSMVQSASFVAGPLSISSHRSRVENENQLMKQTQIVFTRNIQQAIVPVSRKRATSKPQAPAGAPHIEKVLWSNLRDTCLYMNNGWWSYEVCYQRGVTQFHMDPTTQQVDWVISLGHYRYTDWNIHKTNTTQLFPPGTLVPFVQQLLTDGNHCDLDDPESDPEAVDGAVKRRSVLRFMCSPDGNGHITVEERQQCRYNVDVYLPRLCDTLGMEPSFKHVTGSSGSTRSDEESDDGKKGGNVGGMGGRKVETVRVDHGREGYIEEEEDDRGGVPHDEPTEMILILEDDEYERVEL